MAMTVEEVKRAFRDSVSQEFAFVPTEDKIDYIASKRFQRKMDQLVAAEKNKKWFKAPWKKICLVAVILIMILATAFCFPAVREAITDFFVATFDMIVSY